jgi:hypothetical protein
MDPPPPADWADWPACPQCQARRQVRCPVCGCSGTDFPLAAIEQSGGQLLVLLICASCDDHFRPEMFRRCHQCGYDYGNGISIDEPGVPADSSSRTWIIAAALLAGALVLAAYFYALWW